MIIKLGSIVLCAGDASSTSGDPTGPDGLNVRLSPGTEDYEYINADGIDSEHVGCDRVSVSFGVTRTYATVAAAQSAAVSLNVNAPRQGALTADSATLITQATLRDMDIRQVGCSLLIRYSFEGF